ncbi:MAG: YicC family protein [Clostridia bacterium]|nr:YicC family protein [Oscillospiraceae bacterium]MBQ6701506.1 YicC family protein [Clostridia bacterium]
MIRSMTAYGRATASVEGKEITAEIKSVNSRFLDCNIKISRMYSFLEDRVREYIQARGIKRGKLDLYIGVDVVEKVGIELRLDEAYTESYIKALRDLREKFLLKDDISVMTVAQNREIFTVLKPEEDMEKDWLIIKPVLDDAIDMFIAQREREGEKLKADLLIKKANLMEMTDRIEKMSESCIAGYAEKLENRLKQVLEKHNIEVDSARILTECAIFADKVAVDEEIVRLRSHFDEFDKILENGGAVGKNMDYLLQEMNREVNTTGSKANDADMAHLVVNMKSELEKIREQIQNLE